MASPVSWPSGLNGTGPLSATLTNDYFSGTTRWVDTVNGNNANAGTERELPVKTLAQAVTNSSAGDLIVIEAGSTETLTVTQALSLADLRIIGLGTGNNRPKYTLGAGTTLFTLSGAGTKIENLYFPASTATPTTARLVTSAAEVEISGCYFECGASDTNPAIQANAGSTSFNVNGTTFAATASRPSSGLVIAAAVTDVKATDNTFDGSTYGWSDYALKVSGAATRMYFRNNTFLNRSDFGITITGTSYKMFGVNMSSTGGRVFITA